MATPHLKKLNDWYKTKDVGCYSRHHRRSCVLHSLTMIGLLCGCNFYMRRIGEPQGAWEWHEMLILPLQCIRQLSHVYFTCGLVHFLACPHTTEYMCPTSKKCLYAVHLTHTLCTLKAQLYFLWSQWHPLYFWCPSWDCRVFVFIVSHFRDHLLDLLLWRVLSWDLRSLWFSSAEFPFGSILRNPEQILHGASA